MEVETSVAETTTTETPAPSAPPAPMPPSQRPVPPSIQRENESLTPAEVDYGKSLYRQILPGIMQVPADTVLALGGRTRSGR